MRNAKWHYYNMPLADRRYQHSNNEKNRARKPGISSMGSVHTDFIYIALCLKIVNL